jgi:hypothetical protein
VRTESWSAIGYYDDPDVARERLAVLARRALAEVSVLPRGDRHVVIVSAMVAMYLTSDRALAGSMAESTRSLLRASGRPARGLAPTLRAWRLFYSQRE